MGITWRYAVDQPAFGAYKLERLHRKSRITPFTGYMQCSGYRLGTEPHDPQFTNNICPVAEIAVTSIVHLFSPLIPLFSRNYSPAILKVANHEHFLGVIGAVRPGCYRGWKPLLRDQGKVGAASSRDCSEAKAPHGTKVVSSYIFGTLLIEDQ